MCTNALGRTLQPNQTVPLEQITNKVNIITECNNTELSIKRLGSSFHSNLQQLYHTDWSKNRLKDRHIY